MRCILVDCLTLGFQHNRYSHRRILFQNTFKSQVKRYQNAFYLPNHKNLCTRNKHVYLKGINYCGIYFCPEETLRSFSCFTHTHLVRSWGLKKCCLWEKKFYQADTLSRPSLHYANYTEKKSPLIQAWDHPFLVHFLNDVTNNLGKKK